jgi:serine/threonine-protein kinase
MVGTPRYMSPEQILGKKADHRADIYSLSAVAFEMVTGQAVFEADSDFSLMRAHIYQPPPDPLLLAPLPAGVGPVLLRGLAKSPDERFQSVQELYAALEEASASARAPRPAETKLSPIEPTRPSFATPVESAAPPGPSKLTEGELAAMGHGRPWAWAVGAVVIAGIATVSWQVSRRPVQVPAGEPVTPAPERAMPPAGWVAPDTPTIDAPEVSRTDAPNPGAPATRESTAEAAKSDAPAAPDPKREPPRSSSAKRSEHPKREPKVPASATAPEPPADGPATVNIVSLVGGEATSAFLDVDGIRKGSTPLRLTLPAGQHELVFQRAGFKIVTKQILLRAGEEGRVRVELTPDSS